ncbi:NAD(P)/FAD-dependent oxidoreductase [Luteolibacter arcticus]|uniref:NAD(P)/FAD-dependent oxidoreductase n=1 Tax=Luteolibacter arcticus TaxID=1581411 RepID=A0ABT3GQQ1_9BACT|nr:NAD(P)/FAD-dependent oxidoreductase [Luteolibacter arcticus]MCW1925838.1 NAD(P)/FAD-dependent oxidoreductase [Luteolibacter arcticus]
MLLGRCRRRVALFDEGRPRNEMSSRVNCFLGIPASSPVEILQTGRGQVAAYPNVSMFKDGIEQLEQSNGIFRVVSKGGGHFHCRAMVIATGLIDSLPDIPGMAECYGKSVFPCPYCDGWENADGQLAVIGSGKPAADLAAELLLWSDSVALFVTGQALDDGLRKRLQSLGVTVHASPVLKLRNDSGKVSALELGDGTVIGCTAIFLVATQIQHHDFLDRMGCNLTDGGQAECDDAGRTPMPGLFVAGNASSGLQLAMIAAADGLKCAVAANEWLLQQDQP